jgi:glycosyltransferase involved in cell wall biosynthesis
MKVLFDHPSPFSLMHGGFQRQIEQTKAALEKIGVPVEYLRWWDDSQRGGIIHYFGRPPEPYVEFAHGKNIKVVFAELLTGLGSRSAAARKAQKALMIIAQKALPAAFTARMAWKSIRLADACVALTAWEAQLMSEMFGADTARVHVVPNGVEAAFFEAPPAQRGAWLVCTATITERKRVLELAEAAVHGRVPVWVVGKPYSDSDPYGQRFIEIAKRSPAIIRYEGAINDRSQLARIYREARGFVLLSTMESLSLSALEAAACECPLLLSDLPWARTVFKESAWYCPADAEVSETARRLKEFYDAAPGLQPPPRPLNWEEVAVQLKSIYEGLLKAS